MSHVIARMVQSLPQFHVRPLGFFGYVVNLRDTKVETNMTNVHLQYSNLKFLDLTDRNCFLSVKYPILLDLSMQKGKKKILPQNMRYVERHMGWGALDGKLL